MKLEEPEFKSLKSSIVRIHTSKNPILARSNLQRNRVLPIQQTRFAPLTEILERHPKIPITIEIRLLRFRMRFEAYHQPI